MGKKVMGKNTRAKAPIDPSRKWSLEELREHLPSASPDELTLVRASILDAHAEDELVELGSHYRTEDILAVAPNFLVGTILALEVLEEHDSEIELPPGFTPVMVTALHAEALTLRQVDADWELESRRASSNIEERREELRRIRALANRRRVQIGKTLLRSVVPKKRSAMRARIQRALGKAATPAALAASLRTVSEVLAELHKSKALAPRLALFNLPQAQVAALDGLADRLITLSGAGAQIAPPQKTSQAVLDRQDGIVLHLLKAIWTTLVDLKAEGAPIEIPSLRPIERLVEGSASSGEADEGPDGEEPIEGGEDQDDGEAASA